MLDGGKVVAGGVHRDDAVFVDDIVGAGFGRFHEDLVEIGVALQRDQAPLVKLPHDGAVGRQASGVLAEGVLDLGQRPVFIGRVKISTI